METKPAKRFQYEDVLSFYYFYGFTLSPLLNSYLLNLTYGLMRNSIFLVFYCEIHNDFTDSLKKVNEI